jgi:uncharacterized metal-binding protein
MSLLQDDDAIKAAVEGAASVADACRRLGVSPRGASHARMKAAIARLGLSIEATARRSPSAGAPRLLAVAASNGAPRERGVFRDERRVREACAGASSRKQILEHLGVALAAKNYARLAMVAEDLDIALPEKKPTGVKPKHNAPRLATPAQRKQAAAKISPQDLLRAVEGAASVAEVTRRLGLSPKHAGQVRRASAEHGIPLPVYRAADPDSLRAWLLANVLVAKGHFIPGQRLRKYLVESGLREDVCADCGLGPEWNGAILVLQIDHVNGDSTDNRPENLAIRCPNCHSQTETFAGRNAKRRRAAG